MRGVDSHALIPQISIDRSLPFPARPPAARRPREGNKRSVLPAAPFRLFPPSCSRPLRTRLPRPRNAPPPRWAAVRTPGPASFWELARAAGRGRPLSGGWAV